VRRISHLSKSSTSVTRFGTFCVLPGALKEVPSGSRVFCSPRILQIVLSETLVVFSTLFCTFNTLFSAQCSGTCPFASRAHFFIKLYTLRTTAQVCPLFAEESDFERIWWHFWSYKIHSTHLTLVFLLMPLTVPPLYTADLMTLRVQENELYRTQ
jgi:hypothetical protein